MSLEKSTYLIVGYDLSMYKDDILTDEFCQSDEYDELTCCQVPGAIQFFVSSSSLYFGYIVGVTSEYGSNNESVLTFSQYLSYNEIVSNELIVHIPQHITSIMNDYAKIIMLDEYI